MTVTKRQVIGAVERGRKNRKPAEAHTLRVYRGHVRKYINPALGSVKLSKLSKAAVTAFRDSLIDKAPTRATVKSILTSFKGIVSEALHRELISRDPTKKSKSPGKKGRATKSA